MQSSGWSDSILLAEWADQECRHIDLIASWETLLSVYQVLGFSGPDTDDAKLTEFKQIITEMNRFLTRMRSGLVKSQTPDDAIEFLMSHVYATEMGSIKNRQNIAYNKLKQRWIIQSIAALQSMAALAVEEGERDAE